MTLACASGCDSFDSELLIKMEKIKNIQSFNYLTIIINNKRKNNIRAKKFRKDFDFATALSAFLWVSPSECSFTEPSPLPAIEKTLLHNVQYALNSSLGTGLIHGYVIFHLILKLVFLGAMMNDKSIVKRMNSISYKVCDELNRNDMSFACIPK